MITSSILCEWNNYVLMCVRINEWLTFLLVRKHSPLSITIFDFLSLLTSLAHATGLNNVLKDLCL